MTQPLERLGRLGHFPGRHRLNNAIAFIERHARRRPQAIALKWIDPLDRQRWAAGPGDAPLPHRHCTYAQLDGDVARVAGGLHRLGLRPGERAIVFVPMSPAMYVAMFAVMRLGAIPVFLDSWARHQQLGVCSDIVQPRLVITTSRVFAMAAELPALAAIPLKVCVDAAPAGCDTTLEELACGHPAPMAAMAQEETALVTFTTGSSGVPKGANRTHRFLAAQHEALERCIPYRPGDVDLPLFPIFSLNNLASGITSVLPGVDLGMPHADDARILLAQIRHGGVNCATLNLRLLEGLAELCAQQAVLLPQLRRVVTGGAPIGPDSLIRFKRIAEHTALWVLYGSTEVEPMAHIEAGELLARHAAGPADGGVNVGVVAEGLRHRFIRIDPSPVRIERPDDWHRLQVAEGEAGELIVAGAHACRDYYNDPQAFARAKIVDLDGTVWHRTGDVARSDGQGRLWILGRVHNVVRRAGRCLFPVPAELALKAWPGAAQAAFLGLPDPSLGERAVCVLQMKPGAPGPARDQAQDQDRAQAEVRRFMDRHGIPVDAVVFVPHIPMDPRHHSKVDYDLLRAMLLARDEGQGGKEAHALA